MNLGINNGFAMKRWPEPEAWAEIVADTLLLSEVQMSLDMLDLSLTWHALKNRCRTVSRCTEDRGLAIRSVFTGLADYSRNMLLDPDASSRYRSLEYYQRAIDACALLGADVFGGHMGAFSVASYRSTDHAVLEHVLFDHLASLADYGHNAGLREILWEAMPINREPPHTVGLAKEYVARVNQGAALPIRICLDVGHTCAAENTGEEADPYYWISELASITTMIHLQQTDGKGDRHWPFTSSTNAVGIIEAQKVLSAIESASDSAVRSLIIEVFPPFEEADDKVLNDMKETCEYWRRHIV